MEFHMEFINKIRRSLSDSLVKFAFSGKKEMESKVIRHSGFKNVFGLYTEEFAGLTAYNVKHYFESARKGLNFFKASLFEEVKRKDIQIGGVCQSRKLGITGRHKLNRPADLVKESDNEIRDFVITNLSKLNLPVFISDIVDASITGVSNFEINYENLDGRLYLKNVVKIPNELILYDETLDRYVYLAEEDRDIFKLRSVMTGFDDRLDLSRLNTIELPEEKVLEVHALDGNAGNGLMNGCIDSLIWAFFFKSYLIKDLATFLELFAIPAIIGKYDPLMNREDKVKFDNAIRDFGNHFRMIVSKDAEIEFVTDTNKGSSSEIYHRTLEYWDKKIAIRVLGQNLSTEVDTGSYAAAQAHSIIREDFIVSDMILCETAVNSLIRKLVDLNFTGVSEYPVFEFPETKGLDEKKKLAEIYESLSGLGISPDKDEITRELGIKTAGDREIVERLKEFSRSYSFNGEMKEFLDNILIESV